MSEHYFPRARLPSLMRERTQVIPNDVSEGLIVTQRAKHSAHVVTIGEAICLNLQLYTAENVEHALAVSDACILHDVGHPPFGHKGESVLNEILNGYGGDFNHGDFAPEEARRQGRSDLTVLLLEAKRDEEVQVAKIVHDWADDISWTTVDLEEGVRLGYLDFNQEGIENLGIVQEAVKLAEELPIYRHGEKYSSTWNLWLITDKLSNVLIDSIVFKPKNIDQKVPKLSNGTVLNGSFLMVEPVNSELIVLKEVLLNEFYAHHLINDFFHQVPEIIKVVFENRIRNFGLVSESPLEIAEAVCLEICSLTELELVLEYQNLTGKTVELCKAPLREVPVNPGSEILAEMFRFDL
jgi:dGTP triphosphohydrolase